MSHISSSTCKLTLKGLPVAVVTEGVKVAAQLSAFNGLCVTDHIYDWYWNKVQSWDGLQIICSLGAERGTFRGLGLAVGKDGQLKFVGDFFGVADKVSSMQVEFARLMPQALQYALTAMIAQAKGQKCEVLVDNQTKSLLLVVEQGE